jgi:hypothetical protein
MHAVAPSDTHPWSSFMNCRVFSAALVVAASLVAVPVAAQDMSGDWEITSEGRRGPQTSTMTIVQADGALTGSMTLTMGGGRRGGGGGGGGAQEIEISKGEVDGNTFSFTVVLSFGGNSIERAYSGTFDGDSMEGTAEGGRGGGQPFTGKRGG